MIETSDLLPRPPSRQSALGQSGAGPVHCQASSVPPGTATQTSPSLQGAGLGSKAPAQPSLAATGAQLLPVAGTSRSRQRHSLCKHVPACSGRCHRQRRTMCPSHEPQVRARKLQQRSSAFQHARIECRHDPAQLSHSGPVCAAKGCALIRAAACAGKPSLLSPEDPQLWYEAADATPPLRGKAAPDAAVPQDAARVRDDAIAALGNEAALYERDLSACWPLTHYIVWQS